MYGELLPTKVSLRIIWPSWWGAGCTDRLVAMFSNFCLSAVHGQWTACPQGCLLCFFLSTHLVSAIDEAVCQVHWLPLGVSLAYRMNLLVYVGCGLAAPVLSPQHLSSWLAWQSLPSLQSREYEEIKRLDVLELYLVRGTHCTQHIPSRALAALELLCICMRIVQLCDVQLLLQQPTQYYWACSTCMHCTGFASCQRE